MAPVVAAVWMATVGLGASGGPSVDVATRTKGSGRVVIATVADVQPRYDVNEHGDRIIVSQAYLAVEESLKGAPAQLLPVDIEGGTIGDVTLSVSDMPKLKKGDRAVFFLDARVTSAGAHRLHGRGLGVLKLDNSNHVAGTRVTLQDVKAAIQAGR
jgi:hypothetical protein